MVIISEYQEEEERSSDEVVAAAAKGQEVEAAKEKEQKDQEENSSIVPNDGNGMDLEKYSWTQDLQEVNVSVPVPTGTKSRFVTCDIKKNHLKVGLKGQPPIIDGELHKAVKPDECYWNIEDQNTISILLTKLHQLEWWKCIVKGDPEIDTKKVEPESSRLSDLNPETRKLVEKMMFNQSQKSKGLPTSGDIEKQELMKKFMSEPPEMNPSRPTML